MLHYSLWESLPEGWEIKSSKIESEKKIFFFCWATKDSKEGTCWYNAQIPCLVSGLCFAAMLFSKQSRASLQSGSKYLLGPDRGRGISCYYLEGCSQSKGETSSFLVYKMESSVLPAHRLEMPSPWSPDCPPIPNGPLHGKPGSHSFWVLRTPPLVPETSLKCWEARELWGSMGNELALFSSVSTDWMSSYCRQGAISRIADILIIFMQYIWNYERLSSVRGNQIH